MNRGDVFIPKEFARHTTEVFGQTGARWLAELPSLVRELAERWQLVIGSPFELSYGYVVSARRADGAEVVLKIGVPDPETAQGIAALRRYDGDGACRLLEADEDRGAMLLERLGPGETLVDLAMKDDEEAARVAAALMRQLWRSVSEGPPFGPLAEWFEAFPRHRSAYGGPGPIPVAMLARAEALAVELLTSSPTSVLLHGDLHHYNILLVDRAPWLAIYPKGIYGDPGYEVGPFLLNPYLGEVSWDATKTLGRRLDVFAEELSYDRSRLRDWGIAHAVLSACWSAESHGAEQTQLDQAIAVAEALVAL